MLITFGLSSVVFAATDAAFCSTLYLYNWQKLRNLHAAPAISRLRPLLILFCPAHLRILCAARFWQLLFYVQSSAFRSCPAFGDYVVFCDSSSLGRGLVTTTTEIRRASASKPRTRFKRRKIAKIPTELMLRVIEIGYPMLDFTSFFLVCFAGPYVMIQCTVPVCISLLAFEPAFCWRNKD